MKQNVFLLVVFLVVGLIFGYQLGIHSVDVPVITTVDTVYQWKELPPEIKVVEKFKTKIKYQTKTIDVVGEIEKPKDFSETVEFENDTARVSFVRRQTLLPSIYEALPKPIYDSIRLTFKLVPERVITTTKEFERTETARDKILCTAFYSNRGFGVGLNYKIFDNVGLGIAVVY